MSKSNVHPDHYKTAGRERQGENVLQNVEKARLTTRPRERRAHRPLAAQTSSLRQAKNGPRRRKTPPGFQPPRGR